MEGNGFSAQLVRQVIFFVVRATGHNISHLTEFSFGAQRKKICTFPFRLREIAERVLIQQLINVCNPFQLLCGSKCIQLKPSLFNN